MNYNEIVVKIKKENPYIANILGIINHNSHNNNIASILYTEKQLDKSLRIKQIYKRINTDDNFIYISDILKNNQINPTYVWNGRDIETMHKVEYYYMNKYIHIHMDYKIFRFFDDSRYVINHTYQNLEILENI